MSRPSDVLLRCRGVTKRFGGVVALRDVTLEVEPAGLVGLIGPNGAGKSTLLNVICGLTRPDAGTVELEGQDITGLPAHAVIRRGVGRVLQIPRLFPSLTVEQTVRVGALFGSLHTPSPREADRRTAEALELVGLRSRRREPVGRLNTQERRLVDLARALAGQPRLLLVDELMSGLNPLEIQRCTALLREVRSQRKVGIVWVEHVMDAVLGTVERVVVLDHGALIAQGPPTDVASDPAVVEAYLGVELQPAEVGGSLC
ncbi:Lipopolysaccharide export system ATP-binding protein LptB [bacterium HR32]|jgi:branched-chain amino acid transport system ATP-binding protein|nr:Lipopolysaccharide export system ATP-binding protein LptB [bacterium HR32]